MLMMMAPERGEEVQGSWPAWTCEGRARGGRLDKKAVAEERAEGAEGAEGAEVEKQRQETRAMQRKGTSRSRRQESTGKSQIKCTGAGKSGRPGRELRQMARIEEQERDGRRERTRQARVMRRKEY